MPGDPAYREAQLCTEIIADTAPHGLADAMELNPALDVRKETALQAVDLIESLLGKSIFTGNGQRLQNPEAKGGELPRHRRQPRASSTGIPPTRRTPGDDAGGPPSG